MAFTKALIVDDSKLARITLRKKLEALGVQADMAESAKQAYEMLKSNVPEVIFMDHLMPDIDGFEATQKIRTMAGVSHLPIIMCTGKEHDGYLEEAQAIGANYILSKPPGDEALAKVLAMEFGGAPAAAVAEVAATVAVPEPEVEEAVIEVALPEVEEDVVAEIPVPVFEDESGDDASYASFDEDLDVSMSAVSSTSGSSMFDDFELSPEMEEPIEVDVAPAAAVAPSVAVAPAAVAAIDEAKIEALVVSKCQEILNARKAEFINDTLNSLSLPEAPAPDAAAIAAVVESVLEQKLPTLAKQMMQSVANALQAKLDQQVQAALASAPQQSMSEDVVSALVTKNTVALIDQVVTGTDSKLQQQQQAILQEVAFVKASAEGLVNEALEKIDEATADNNLAEEIALLQAEQAQIKGSLGLPKALSAVALALAVVALGGIAFLHFLA